ncbi:MAG TPA: hypothetical protein PKO36_04375 [Candidatus Hydrogenedentes bacterium]|nr:hypothetical protein [Candidatus Hydrogenedentota bacterium]HOT49670.1 hypothetical protein [Candidatus Hydrogenedentota bacterium]HOV72957.1 hypothetical protein [Candidatus Hydrogenedentota bacterium]HPC15803.1 hypothetical protein [Candidatus Hydrogenedentota bacterium]HRT19788.1 hypothetical protein [Candidatus Hydrogenedentota bacterium]
MRYAAILLAATALCVSCSSGREGGVINNVLTDFGLRAKPEGYRSETDEVMQRLGNVGPSELKRLNAEAQKGQIKFQQTGDLKGKYYKEVKVYESFYPTDAQSVSRGGPTEGERGFTGYIDYAYRIYQSPRKNSSSEAEGETASIPTDITGRETYRYNFGPSGEWNGSKGEKVK